METRLCPPGAASSGPLGVSGKGAMKMKSTLAFLLSLALVTTALAGEPENIAYQDSKITLRLDWPWTKPEMGRYSEQWSDNYGVQNITATWHSGFDVIQIYVARLAPSKYWRYLREVNQKFLEGWTYLENLGVSEVRNITCDVDKCVEFKADVFDCAGFSYYTGSTGDMLRSDRLTDFVAGYYCSGSDDAGKNINTILDAIDLIREGGKAQARVTQDAPFKTIEEVESYIEQNEQEMLDILTAYNEETRAFNSIHGYTITKMYSHEVVRLNEDRVFVSIKFCVTHPNNTYCLHNWRETNRFGVASDVRSNYNARFEFRWVGDELEVVGHKKL